MDFLTNLKMNQNEIQKPVIHLLATEPAGIKGQLYFNSASNTLHYHDGTDWISVGTSSATGDITAVLSGTRIDVTGGSTGDATVNLDAATVAEIVANNAKTGITSGQAANIVTNLAKIGITPAQAAEISANTSKISYTDSAAVALNTAKIGITTQQASDITDNNAKISYTDSAAVALNTAKVGITPTQAADIVTNNAKDGITAGQAADIVTNTAKVSLTKANLTSVAATYGGSDTLTIGDSGNDTTVVIKGDLQVDGTTTTVNSTTVDIADLNITVGANAGTSTLANGGGLTVGSAATATWTYSHANARWESNLPISASSFVGDLTGDVTGNADTATSATTAASATTAGSSLTAQTLSTPRNINGVPFNGSADITVTADANTLSGTTLKSTVVSSSLTSVGTLTSGNATAIVDAASTTAAGKVERATDTEAKAQSNASLYVTPAHLGLMRFNSLLSSASTTHTITHSLGTKNVLVQVMEESSGNTVFCDVQRSSTTQVILSFGSATSANEYRVLIVRA